MRSLIILIVLLSVNTVWANEKNEKVDCSKENFYKEVTKEAKKRLVKLQRDKIVEFSNELLDKAAQLDLRELQLQKREEQLRILERNFAKKVRAFDDKQKKIISCIDNRNQKAIKRVQHMVSVIAGMRPKQAAQLLSVQDSDLTVKILGLLPPEKVSKIFNLMDKEVSARLQKQYMTMQK